MTWAEVYVSSYRLLFAMAHRLTHDRIQSQDLVQDTILKCLIQGRAPEDLETPLAYLLRCMRRTWIDHHRKYNKKKYEEVSLDDVLNRESLDANLVVESDVMRSLEKEERMKTLRANSESLTADERLLLRLRVDDHTADEIAEMLDKDVRVIRYELNKLMAKMRYRVQHKRRQNVT